MSASRRTVGFNFLREPELPAPNVSEAQAESILAHYGLTAHARALGSQQDKNFVVEGSDGSVLGVLKIANPAFNAAEVDAQDCAAELVAQREPSLRIAVPQANLAGEKCTRVEGLLDGPVLARLLSFLPGGTLIESGHLSSATVSELGTLAGKLSRALADFRHPGLDRVLQWDPQYAAEVVTQLIDYVADRPLRLRLQEAADAAWARITSLSERLPRQAVHLDLTDANVVVDPRNRHHPDGVIDFGDLSETWAICELAVTISSILHHAGATPVSVLPAVRAFHAVRPLSEEEIEALWPLVVMRTVVLIVSDAQQVILDPGNDYVTAQVVPSLAKFAHATSVPFDVMTALLKDELGFSSTVFDFEVAAPLIAGLDHSTVTTLDLRPESDAMDGGAWLRDTVADDLAASAMAAGAAAVVTRYGEPRLDKSRPLRHHSPDVVATGLDLWLASPAPMVAPWDGEVTATQDSVTLRGNVNELEVFGVQCDVAAAGPVRAGTPIAKAPSRCGLHVAVRPAGAPPAPRLVRHELAAGWHAVTRDPRPLLGFPVLARRPPDAALLTRRERSFAQVQEHYYDAPPQIERGWRHFLVSADARAYLDMVNNVTILGHAHPRVAETAARQLRKLNTNSRFNYEAVVEFSERLTALLPEPLDSVFLVNSGSEASDLALRLALAATGRRDVLAMREAYHGWTYATDAVSTSVADNPNALSTRPDWVHTVESPNSFRGKYRGPEAGRYAAEAADQIARLAADGHPPACFISETVYGNAGGMALPDGYLAQVYSAVREYGGLAVADEVQVGYGRLGQWFWGFEQQNVVPDIVAVAKSTGNGYPLGVVVTSRAIADAFRSQGYFFSSTGGSPLSCAIGITVLDVLRDEELQRNAASVGTHLKAKLQALQKKYPIIGTVHGFGLYLGVELVRDPGTLEPATRETSAICDRMLELGVVIQPTGDHQNILKTKPPLCLDVAGADFYVDTLERVLSEGW